MIGQRTFAGIGGLIRLILRRDRVRIPIWILALVGFTTSFLPSLPDLYPDAASRQARAAIMEGPAGLAMTGPGYGLDDYTLGAMVGQEFFGYSAIIIAIMSILLTIRHTRAEEETGRAELIRAAVIGRHAPLAAAVTVVVSLNVVIALLLGLLMPAVLPELSAASSMLYGFAGAAVGIVFAGVGAVAAQLTFSARGAVGIGMAALGFAYGARAVGDASVQAFSWLSPIGWAQQTRFYVDDRWWPLLLATGVAVLLFVGALGLSRRRDVGAGIFAPRVGAADASPFLSGPIGLAWRLQRGTFIAWSIGLAVFGAMYGSIIPEIETFVEGNEFIAQSYAMMGGDPVESFLGIVVMLLATVSGGYALQSALRMRGEETGMRTESILSGSVPRWRYVLGHLLVAAIGGPVVALVGIGAMATVGAAATGDAGLVGEVLAGAAAYVPALWLLTGLVVALFGLLPKLVHLVWIVLAYGIVIGMLGAFLNIPDWTMNLSPFSHVPQWPNESFDAVPLVAMTVTATGLVAIGLFGFRRRDLA
ncbi:ABC-2 type transport system permease protein [Stackebrandtia endophytica]|uniref:ABC-2 type transport system permease protein n=1 Tax=Stackebrandtia endophytica TaxID=1496996 RepID=A0A543AW18_9ACTN|nr:ABC transporter permease [Stackebrandtia endophytica]TQL76777.1 ABC-2 type transport system permease protein [Stackebrandtia endophytica]